MNNLFLYLVVNHSAGSGNCKKKLPEIQTELEKRNISYKIIGTKYVGHAYEIAEELAQKKLYTMDVYSKEEINPFPLLVVIGGDGTLHEAVNGLARVSLDIPIGYIPCGSGNDFARGVGISKKPLEALKQILDQGRPQRSNLLHYREAIQEEEGYVVNNVGIGLDAAIVHATTQSTAKKQLNRYHIGSFSYLFSVLGTLFRQKGFPMNVHINGKELNFRKAFLCTTTNHPYFGGGLAISPPANSHQTNMNIVILERIALIKIVYLIFLLFRKKHLRSKHVFHEVSEKIRIISTTEQYGQTDGEDMGKRSFDITFTTANHWLWM